VGKCAERHACSIINGRGAPCVLLKAAQIESTPCRRVAPPALCR
jgi:hypothetical protein